MLRFPNLMFFLLYSVPRFEDQQVVIFLIGFRICSPEHIGTFFVASQK